MAIAQMKKIMIVSHRKEADQLLEALQQAGIAQVLDAEKAMVTKDWPELTVEGKRPRELEDMISRLETAIGFLNAHYAGDQKQSPLRPLVEVPAKQYERTVKSKESFDFLETTEANAKKIEELLNQKDHLLAVHRTLLPWKDMQADLADLGSLETAECFAGLIPDKTYEDVVSQLADLHTAVENVGKADDLNACIIATLPENTTEVQKVLRNADFEQVTFENMTGTPADNIQKTEQQLKDVNAQLDQANKTAAELAETRLTLQILFDYYSNLLGREQARISAPSTEHAQIFESWVRNKDYSKLKKIVADFPASSVNEMSRGEDEKPPVEITNNRAMRPFEVITRLYGMPQHTEVDPTPFLAPFFAIFFALCLTDAGYGIIIFAACAYLMLKMQGDKKLMMLLAICSVLTVGAGAMVGGWFGNGFVELANAYPSVLGWLEPLTESLLVFDPLEKPMIFFAIACGLGYFQIMFGLGVAMVHNMMQKNWVAALCDQLTWIVMINSLAILLASKMGPVNPAVGSFFGKVAILPAAVILFLSQREGPIAGRLGMGAYNLFSTIFYLGDVLSYLRLMALGMVTGGLAMAINVMAKTAFDMIPIKILGVIIAILVLIGGHLFNTAISALSAFVHTIRLQYVEFFPKFLAGGGADFTPLSRVHKYTQLKKESAE
ncbi:V-type ATP synthase subunit I [Anaerohalosphaera lusitana]|uniref:V-type ATP synthase subunit I n=1 Tax=Anaerohalosphaera lusitana TaxID=1936003 RepID=A0A1U9NKG4_9BACT|nr:V-type ATP synthase subunit I [Anaerohalosphaera lusitana]AQT68006.1 V-type ATP synthase subunit I [Anaerohalosphaera lusitana]